MNRVFKTKLWSAALAISGVALSNANAQDLFDDAFLGDAPQAAAPAPAETSAPAADAAAPAPVPAEAPAPVDAAAPADIPALPDIAPADGAP